MSGASPGTGPQPRRTIVFVLGMGRSGTSALTRVLSLCGGALPAKLLGANDGNPLGHWEPSAALAINEKFLALHGSSWYDPSFRLQDNGALDGEHRAACAAQIEAFLSTLGPAPVVLIKEPRITALSDLWFKAARHAGFDLAAVVAVRHPQEVAASLAARDRASPQLASALWLKYNLLAERCSRSLPRVFVAYPNLLRDWRSEIARVQAALSVDLGRPDEHAIEAFLRADLRRQHHSGEIAEEFGNHWIGSVYEALCAAARDEPLDGSALDGIFASYRACERSFRTALDDFRRQFSGSPTAATVHTPNITRLICEVAERGSAALSHCLRSDWYRQNNPDVFAAGADPYEHWMRHGASEGRLPCEDPLLLLDSLMQERMNAPHERTGDAQHA